MNMQAEKQKRGITPDFFEEWPKNKSKNQENGKIVRTADWEKRKTLGCVLEGS